MRSKAALIGVWGSPALPLTKKGRAKEKITKIHQIFTLQIFGHNSLMHMLDTVAWYPDAELSCLRLAFHIFKAPTRHGCGCVGMKIFNLWALRDPGRVGLERSGKARGHWTEVVSKIGNNPIIVRRGGEEMKAWHVQACATLSIVAIPAAIYRSAFRARA